jgi:hypothetical protein
MIGLDHERHFGLVRPVSACRPTAAEKQTFPNRRLGPLTDVAQVGSLGSVCGREGNDRWFFTFESAESQQAPASLDEARRIAQGSVICAGAGVPDDLMILTA